MYKVAVATFLGVFLALGFALAAAGPPAPLIPKTPAGRLLEGWLNAFDSGDRQTLKKFLQAYEPNRLARLDDLMAFRAMTGGFDLRKIESSTPTKISALVQEHLSDQFARFVIQVGD